MPETSSITAPTSSTAPSSPIVLDQELAKIPGLQGLLISVQPDSLLYDSYIPNANGWATDEIASQLGELLQSNQELLRLFNCSTSSQITIENDDGLIVIKEVGEQFVAGMMFARQTPLALVRAFSQHIGTLLEAYIAQSQTSIPQNNVTNAVRILRYLKQFAPDAHTALMRIALKTGIPITILNQPQHLNEEQTDKIESAVCDVLGLDELVL